MRLNKVSAKVQRHWANNLINAIRFYRTRNIDNYLAIHINTSCCAYCQIYFGKGCIGCPINKQNVKWIRCGGTPFNDVSAIMALMDKYEFNDFESYTNVNMLSRRCVTAIWKEYLFLKKTYRELTNENE